MRSMVEGPRELSAPSGSLRSPPPPLSGGGTAPRNDDFVQSDRRLLRRVEQLHEPRGGLDVFGQPPATRGGFGIFAPRLDLKCLVEL